MKEQTVNRALDIVEKTGSAINDAILQLAPSLGVAAEHVYGVLVRQQVVDGVVTLIFCFAGLLPLIPFVMLARSSNRKFAEFEHSEKGKRGFRNPHSESFGWSVAGVLVYGLLVTIFVGIAAPTAIKKIANPEYYAIAEAADLAGRLLGN